MIYLIDSAGKHLIRIGQSRNTYRSTFRNLTDIAFIHICHHPDVRQPRNREQLFTLIRTQLHIPADLFLHNKTRNGRFQLIISISGEIINGKDFLYPSFFGFGTRQLLLCLKHIFIRSHAGIIHILRSIHVSAGEQQLLFRFFQLFLIVRHFSTADDCQYISLTNIISYFCFQFRHRASKHRIYMRYLIFIKSDPSVQCQFINHFLNVNRIDRYNSQQAICQA